MLTLDDIAQTLIIHDNEGEHKVDVKYLQPLTEQVDDFINCIINDEEPLSDGYVGRDVVRILEYCQTALKQ
jgi:predicted dehydrogenase